MKKTKFNKHLLAEELKRFKRINEYSFYTETENLDDTEVVDDNTPDEEEIDNQQPDQQNQDPQPPVDNTTTQPATPDVPPMEPQAPLPEPSNEVEVDVTDIVRMAKKSTKSAIMANQKTDVLLKKFSELEAKLDSMNNIFTKINDLESEIKKRNPTPIEKLELRSKDSYPYSVKLSDFWSDQKQSNYDIGNDEDQEFILTDDDINDFSETHIKNSLKLGNDNEM